VPPEAYGGTESVVHDLTEALVARGHEVTLFASGDSSTSAELAPVVSRSFWSGKAPGDPVAALFRLHIEAFSRASEFDVIHTHTDYFAFPFASQAPTPVVTTLHGRLDVPHVPELLRVSPQLHLLSISPSHRNQVPDANWIGTVHHGLPLDQYRFDPHGGSHLVFLGRMTPEKAPHAAIDIAVDAGVPLVVAGRVEPLHRDYFEREVKPRFSHPLVRFVGEVSFDEKIPLLAESRGMLFPIDWPEPFGLVMVEAMACGTPVVARPNGSVPEVIADGVTGFVADDHAALVHAVKNLGRIDRAACRRHVAQHFGIDRMSEQYEAIYRRVRR
jgi:glycosyltransferase involved in cell wall biosynthesis